MTYKAQSNRSSAAPETAYELLPAELLLPTVALSSLSASLPAVCCALSPAHAFRSGEQPHRIWLHRAIFIDPRTDPLEPDMLNCRHVAAWQMESHVAYFFKALAPYDASVNPAEAAGMAPDGPMPSQSLITLDFIEWIFGLAGPFRAVQVPKDYDVVAELRAIRGRERPVGGASAHDGVITYPKPPKYPLPNWRLVPDAFLLVTLLIRTSQFAALEFALTRLLAMFPLLGTSRAGSASVWSHYMLDNRNRLRYDLSILAGGGIRDVSMTYPSFLCLLALWDWSLPVIAIIERVFAHDHASLTDIADQATSEFRIFHGMISTLNELSHPPPGMSARVLSVLDWLHSHGGEVNPHLFPFISVYIRNDYRTFADVFLKYDVPNLARIPTSPHHPLQKLLGFMIAEWAAQGHTSVLKVALHKGLLLKAVKKQLLIKAIKSPGEKWADEVVDLFAEDMRGSRMWGLAAKALRALYK